MKQQHSLMKWDPVKGTPEPYPSDAKQYRDWHGQVAWLFNPWTGDERDPRDIGTDVLGLLILPPGEPVYAAPKENAKDLWLAVCEEAQCVVQKDEKYLMLTEEMVMRMSEALGV